VPAEGSGDLKRFSTEEIGNEDDWACPQGQQNSAQGFNLGNPQNKRLALKGREMRVPDEAPTYCRAKVRVRNWDVLPLDQWTPLLPC
jgi:hypothetical protein